MGRNKHFWGFLSVSLGGVIVFVLLPFLGVVKQSFTTVTTREFVGLGQYQAIFVNPAFLLAIKNTCKFMVVCIPILVILGLILALVLAQLQDVDGIKTLYLLPVALPTASVVLVWRMFFYKQDFTSLVVCYVWKNLGYTICLWMAGIQGISKEILEAANVDGAGRFRRTISIILPNLKGSLYTIFMLSILRSFQVYREAYLVAGAHPKKEIYLLQHILNNWFVNLEMDKLAAAAVCVGIVFFIGNLFFLRGCEME